LGQVIGFLGVILLVGGGVHYYLWRRLVRATTRPGRARRVLTWALVALGGLMAVSSMGGRIFGMAAERVLAWPGYLWLAVMFYLLVFLLVLEIPRDVALLVARRRARARPATIPAEAVPAETLVAPGRGSMPSTPTPPGDGDIRPEPVIDRRLFISRTAAAVAGVGALATVGYGMRSALGDPVIERVPIRLAKLDPRMSGLRVAVVADIHLGPLSGRAHTERIVRMINGLRPDLVTIVGDLVDGTVAELGPLAQPLGDLQAPSYFVTGNHEYYTANGPREWEVELAGLGVRSLRNERVEIRRGGAVLDLAGVNDLTGRSSGDGPDLGRALDGRDQSRPVVLLAHQPVQVREAATYGVDLQLSGHTHGGQMAPFNLVVPLQQPVVAGLATVDGTQVYVTRGAGFWGPPVRVGASPEVTLLELQT
jgi:predicted MPP superfamily phosphohydrolase